MITTQRAFEAAMLDFKEKLKGQSFYDQILQTTSIEQVYQDIEKLQDKQAKSGRLRHLSKIEPFLARLREYSSVVETFVQAKPDILALIWGPIKLLLLWADVLKQSFDALLNALEEIGNILPDFCELAEMFADNNRLQELLVLYFRDILQFYLISTKFFSMRRLRVVFEMFWPSHRDRIQVVVKHMASHRDLIRKEVRMEEIRRADELRNRELQHFVQTEENNIAQEYASHRAHISPKSYDGDLYRFSEAVCNGTGKWLFRDLSFQNWLAGKEKAKPILWLRGIPGAGKTLLASSVIKHTQSLDGTHTVFAFLTYLDSHISALSILHSLIFQLASTSLSLKTILCQSDLQHLGTNFKVAATLFQTLIQSAGVVRVIIDGLDEIEPAQRSRLIKELVRLSGECEECHILLTSRAESDISGDLDGKTIDIQVDKNNAGSIQVFINQTMGEWFKERDFIPDVQDQLQGWAAPLAFRAKGMFLYVKVIFRIVYYINDIGDIQNQLEHLPSSLEDAYGRVLQQINASPDPQRRNLARSILGWVGCAPSPMTLKEIEQTLLVDPDCPFKLPRVQARVNVVQICGPIIDIVDGYVQFVHFTVREYIFSTKIQNSITLSEMALDLAIRCVVYMCQGHHDPDLTEDEIDANIIWGAYRLHHFSSSFWLDLIHEYLTLSGSKTIPDTLIDQLRILLETRSSDHYTETEQSESSLHPAILGLKHQEPALVEMLKGCTEFQTSSSKSDFQLNNPEQWFHTSPLSVPKISIALHERLDDLDDEKCSILKSLSYHYGPRCFRCGFLGCHYRRYGFETKTGRQAHEKDHQKPCNCNYPGCRFATQGFISRKMRDDHLKNGHSHAADPGLSDTAPPGKLEDEELQPLMFDLIETNQLEIITSLIPRLRNLKRLVQTQVAIHAAKMGSHSILQLFNDSGLLTGAFVTKDNLDWRMFSDLAERTVRSESVSLSKILLRWVATLDLRLRDTHNFRVAVKNIIGTLMVLESEDLFELWRPILASGFGIAGTSVEVAQAFALQGTIGTTDNIPSRERMLLGIWEEYKVLHTIKARDRHKVLPSIADSSCSVNLARYAIQHGCGVDTQSSYNSLTALQIASRKTTQQAADLMEFLLLQGADPNKRTAKRRIGDEKGAREISKWLGLTWEQLLERTTEERQRNKKNENEGSYSD
ncbi:Vegetative incompatibility protein HET-E-1 [Fusarium oxysporum f. sp. cubense]|uniref:Vegetative incompatibility protein HET-E-1 n=1 Tax=Fusarium oxysporum f. sp. cubense TaxID=61366 RepID=A0A559L1U0_FUSOC|nr:Vegetative incompatibility protein HET-E-1 [Fusarium oxysporum f. sp. cubense]